MTLNVDWADTPFARDHADDPDRVWENAYNVGVSLMAIGMTSITDDNLPEVLRRYDALGLQDHLTTEEKVRAFSAWVGVRTNVSAMTPTAFDKHARGVVTQRMEAAVRRYRKGGE